MTRTRPTPASGRGVCTEGNAVHCEARQARRYSRRAQMFGTTLVLMFVLSCADMPFAPGGGKGGGSAGTGGPRPTSNSVLLVSPENDTLATGESLQLSALDGNGNRISATWSSSDPSIASVSAAGLINAVAPGSATITAKVRQSQASASIEVIEAAEPPSEPEPPPTDSTPPPSDSTPPPSDSTPPPPPPSDTAPAATVNVYPDQGASALIRAVNNATSGAVIRVHGPHTYDIGTTELRPPTGNIQVWGDPVTRGPNGEVYAPTKIVGRGGNVFRLSSRNDITLARLDMSGGKWIGSTDPSAQTGNVILTHNERTRVLLSKVHGGEVTGVSGQGIDLTIEDSELTGNGFRGEPSGTRAAVKNTRSLIVRRSYVHRNEQHGLWTDCNAWTLLVEDSRIEHNNRNGIFYEISTGPSVIRRNIIRYNNNPDQGGARGGIAIHSSKDLVVEQNTFEQNGRAAVYLYEDSRAGVTEGGSCSRGYYVSGVAIRDNRLNSGAVVNAHLATLSGNK